MRAVLIPILLLVATMVAEAQHPARPEVVAQAKAQLQAQGADLSGPCGAWQITRVVAWTLQSEGVGLLDKPSGNNCQGYSVDFITYADGSGVDILGDAGGANLPGWDVAEPPGALLGRWRQPVPPIPTPVPPQPVPSPVPTTGVDPTDLVQRLMRIENQALITNLKVDGLEGHLVRIDQKLIQMDTDPSWMAKVFSNRYVQLAGAAVATWLTAQHVGGE